MSDLKPCPFCGGEAEPFNPFGNTNGTWCVLCSECASATGFEQTEAEAIAAWNTRAQTVFGMTLDEVRQMMKRDAKRERTCKMETDHDELEAIAYSHEDTWAYKCSACDWSFRYDRGIKPNYCPNCGAKVVGE